MFVQKYEGRNKSDLVAIQSQKQILNPFFNAY
jgi:hypothetical protein